MAPIVSLETRSARNVTPTSWENFCRYKDRKVRQMKAIFGEGGTTFQAGCVAGVVGRIAILPVDRGAYGAAPSVWLRGLQFGVISSVYVPLSRLEDNDLDLASPFGLDKAWAPKTFLVFWHGFAAGVTNRLLTNPFGRVRWEKAEYGMPYSQAVKSVFHDGPIQFWKNQHPIMINGLHTGMSFAMFSIFRRGLEWHFMKPSGDDDWQTHTALNFLAGGLGAAASSVICWGPSEHFYLGKVRRDSMITLGFRAAVLKEAPMFAVSMATLGFLTHYWNPEHYPAHGGLGFSTERTGPSFEAKQWRTIIGGWR